MRQIPSVRPEITLKLRGEDASVVVDLVKLAEKNSAFFNRSAPGKNAASKRAIYHGGNDWLSIADKTAYRPTLGRIARSLAAIFGRPRTASGLRLMSHVPIGYTNIAASHIRVKNSIIVLYPELGLVLKAMKPDSFRHTDALKNEYGCLKTAFAAGFGVPEPLAYETNPFPCLWLRYVNGRNPRKKDVNAGQRLAEILFQWYEHSGLEFLTAQDYTPLLDTINLGRDGLSDLGWHNDAAEQILRALERAANSKKNILVSHIHGDASTGNVLTLPNDDLILLDWELSRRDLVSFDMLKLTATSTKIERRYATWRAKLNGIGLIDYRDEMALATILRSIRLTDKRRYYKEFLGLNSKDTDLRIDATQQRVTKACMTWITARVAN